MTGTHASGLIFGGFQPVLRVHLQILLGALEQCDRLIIALDGLGSAPSTMRPWTCAQRESQLRQALPEGAAQRVTFVRLRDHLYQPARWVAALKAALTAVDVAPDAVALIATEEEAAALALRGFSPVRRLDPFETQEQAAEAAVRADFLRGGNAWRSAVTSRVVEWLDAFQTDPARSLLSEEQAWVDRLAEAWRGAPYPPIFVTADAVVIASGHILMIHRRHAPARELWALPGGFVEQNETVVEAALRELVEETGISVSRDELRRAIRDTRVFDAPERSVRGRTITHGTLIDLGDARPPAVRAGDDAGAAAWWTLERFAQSTDSIAEDHAWIVRAFVPDLP